jgi:hypothetical protein
MDIKKRALPVPKNGQGSFLMVTRFLGTGKARFLDYCLNKYQGKSWQTL